MNRVRFRVSPVSSVIRVHLMGGKMEGCRQMKRGRKLRIQADAKQWLLLFFVFFVF